MSDTDRCPDCGRTISDSWTRNKATCQAAAHIRAYYGDGSEAYDTEKDCLRLTVARMRPVMQTAQALRDARKEHECAWRAYNDAPPDEDSREESRHVTATAQAMDRAMGELEAALDVCEGKAGTP